MTSSDNAPTPRHFRRRTVLQWSGIAAAATGIGALGTQHAAAAEGNCLQAGGEGSLKAFGRTAIPATSGTFRISLDYLYPAGTMSGYYLFSSFDTAYRDPRIVQTGDELTVTTSLGSHVIDQRIAPDVWHQVVLDFVPGFVTVFVDGVRLTSGSTTRFALAESNTLTYFGYLGDLSTATYNGTAFYDNLLVTAGGTTVFEQRFDDGAPVKWTQMSTAGAGVFGLASPARNSDVGSLVAVSLDAPEVGVAGKPFAVRVAGTDAAGHGCLVESDTVTLTASPAGVTVTAEPGGYFAVGAAESGTVTLTATATVGGGTTMTATVAVRDGGLPGKVTLATPVAPSFVGDRMRLVRTVTALDGSVLDPGTLTWSFSSSDTAVATVDAVGEISALAAGKVTVTATAAAADGTTVSGAVDVAVEVLETAKTRATYWTTERRATALANVAAYGWARAQRDAAVASADLVLKRGHRALWDLVTSQNIPRSYGFSSNEQQGCLNCGTDVHAFGQYPYTADVVNKPWKITCPSCKFDFPTNDFAAYYAGGLDTNGFFDPDQAKRHDDALIADGGTGNLVNIGHPEKGEGWGVDNGAGTMLANGTRYTPIAYYNHWKLWYSGDMATAITALTNAYLYTGEVKYASAGIVLLDRVADIYPSLNLDQWTYPNGYLNSNGNTSRGKAVGSIWETGLIRAWILAYDAFYPALADDAENPVDPAALQFLDSASHLMDKSNVKRIRRNIEDGVLRAILPAVKRGEIRGNNGMHQATLAAAAVVLDHLPETDEWLAFDFATGTVTGTEVKGGNMGSIFINDVDRDGNGNEAAPGYNGLWLNNFTLVADYLDGYRLEGMQNYDLYSNVKFLKMFDGIYPLTMLGSYTPTIGDTGSTGNPVLSVVAGTMVKAFTKTGRSKYAQVAHWLNGRTSTGLRLGIFDADPEKIAADIEAIVATDGPWVEPAKMLTGYGFSALRDGEPPAAPEPPQLSLAFGSLEAISQTRPSTYVESSGTLQFEGVQVGDAITFAFDVDKAVSGQLQLGIWQAATYGVYRVELDGTTVADKVSFRGGGVGIRELAQVDLAAGQHQITFTLVDDSTGAKCGLRTLMVGTAASGPVDVGTQRGSTLYFGRNGGHGHRDNLNIDHFAFGLDLLPDMGYPRYANSIDMHRKSLVINTISHNTVVVNERGQTGVVVGQPQLFDAGPAVQVVDVDTPQAYQNTTSRYRRTLAQVRIDEENSYLVDLFRVVGGSQHLYSFHAMEATSVTVDGATLVPQQDSSGAYVGTYAGRDVPYDDTVDDPSGFSYFYDVDRVSGDIGSFSATWGGIKDTWGVLGTVGAPTDVNLRITLLGSHADVALASCEPPQNKPGNPKSLRYLLATSPVTNSASLFTAVIEPYRGQRLVQQVETVAITTEAGDVVADQEARAVRVTLGDGRVDTIVHALDPSRTYLVDGRRFSGSFGVLITRPGKQDEVHLVGAGEFGPSVFAEAPALTGTVADFTRTLAQQNSVTVTLDADLGFTGAGEDLVGRYLFADDDGVRNAVYRIDKVEAWSSTEATFSLDNVTPIRSYVDANDFDKGFVFDLAEGRTVRIPLQIGTATDPGARLRALLEQYGSQLQRPAGAQLKALVERATAQQEAGRVADAGATLTELRTQLDGAGVKGKLSAAAYGWLVAVVEGWLRTMGE